MYQIKSRTHAHMSIPKPYQKNKACDFIEHIRPRIDASPYLDHIRGGVSNTGAGWHPLTSH
jgi:hypothetical protein